MKLGLSLSNNQGIEEVHDIVRLAVSAEALGLDSVWASDHVFNASYGLGTAPAEMVEKRRAFARVGVETVVVSPYTRNVQEMARSLEVLAREVKPALSSAG